MRVPANAIVWTLLKPAWQMSLTHLLLSLPLMLLMLLLMLLLLLLLLLPQPPLQPCSQLAAGCCRWLLLLAASGCCRLLLSAAAI